MAGKQEHTPFKEGETRIFSLFNSIEISGEEYFVLIDEFGKKHLLEANPYKLYQLEIGNEIECRIDKINCAGKIFLEPLNPFYKEGGAYSFEVQELVALTNSFGQEERHCWVLDSTKKKHRVWLPKDFPEPRMGALLELQVAQIRKGEFLLVLPQFALNNSCFASGSTHSFTIIDVCTLVGQKEFYVVIDRNMNTHFLRAKFFDGYGFEIGKSFHGTIVKHVKIGSYYIEPDRPYVQVGNEYLFSFVKEDVYYHASGLEEEVWVVRDQQGHNAYLFYDAPPNDSFKENKIPAFVERIFKGKLYLRFAQR